MSLEAIMKLYVTRHGQTVGNVDNLVCGQKEYDLTDKGRAQAKALAQQIKTEKIKIDRIITSPIGRAKETAAIINEVLQVPITEDNRVAEFDFGDFDGKSNQTSEFAAARRQFVVPLKHGESWFKAAQRAYNFLDDIKYDDEVTLVVCHNAINRVIHSYFCDMPNDQYFDYNIDNCELTYYES
ncbi:MAG TPA: histidine phosphatase family protein [Bavariicoccus seileri]|uniref:Histidine phosphatase family protein n=2 Tax=Bavariicoccus seileri TaxID=549685 RepID=A0A3D4S545_9ENTE|nr:histidine phosphatase family protein [Bavariicoccus seileri]